MNILKNIEVPTGNILIVQGEKGKIECLSLGDYGKDVNLKSDALGLDREITKVVHKEMLPLTEKWVVTISTQYGCSMNCSFCDVPKVGPGVNATCEDMIKQVETAISLHPEIKQTKRLNIHFARMGEPTWNQEVLKAAREFNYRLPKSFYLHPVVSTMMPSKNKQLKEFIHNWMEIKNIVYGGEAGLQLSINSTNEQERREMFGGNACTLKEIGEIMTDVTPKGRKITLNFALADYKIDPDILLDYFDPGDYIIKITPMHKTVTALSNDIKTDGDYTTYYPYKETEEKLKNAGYDVLVFIASEYEDLGRITCGNAILSGTLPDVPHTEVER